MTVQKPEEDTLSWFFIVHFPADIDHSPRFIDQFSGVIVHFPEVIDHFPRVIVIS
ncbi:hypothetical protein [Sporosarcina luteola]|uniref:hypothetical protein n=1 Tax=Sporosarcina luteola TaxID=582850 RepID=UPI00203B3D92|nr:hypothetical protein [Sporosarcina luteola]MCM3709349.1 hypothetical protein [Sporosarcina luteola]